MKSPKRTSKKRSPSTTGTKPAQPEPSESIDEAYTVGSTASTARANAPDCTVQRQALLPVRADGQPWFTHPTTLEDLKLFKTQISTMSWPARPVVDLMFRGSSHVELTVDVLGFRVVSFTYEIANVV